MAFDPSRMFSASSGRTAAILGLVALLGVLAAFVIRMFGYQGKFPGPSLSGEHKAKDEDQQKGQ